MSNDTNITASDIENLFSRVRESERKIQELLYEKSPEVYKLFIIFPHYGHYGYNPEDPKKDILEYNFDMSRFLQFLGKYEPYEKLLNSLISVTDVYRRFLVLNQEVYQYIESLPVEKLDALIFIRKL